MAQQSKIRESPKELAEFVTSLELLIESDDTYGLSVTGFTKTDPEYFAFIHNTLRGK